MKARGLCAWSGSLMATVLLVSSSAFAIGDQWRDDATWVKEKPHGEPNVPGFYMNLGPTGLRARLRDLSFEVKYVFPDSPAAGKVRGGDVITGVNGKPFTTRHTFGYDWKLAKHGYEGPMMDLGNAIEESEGSDGVLTLKIKRGDQELDAKLQLRPLGSFSGTYPYNCKKSNQLFMEICEDLAKTEREWLGSWRVVSVNAGLALLASGKPEYLPICKRVAESAKQVNPNEAEGLNNWNLAYSGIYLSEYYLITHDASVLPALEQIHKGFLFSQVEPGSWQHQKNWGGYPELGIMVGLINTTWALMDKTGFKFDLAPYEMTRKRVAWLTTKDGHVLYARTSEPGWDKEPMKVHGPVGPGEGTGRGGAGMMGIYLSGHGEPKSDELVLRMGKYLTEYQQYFPDTHACPTVGIQWMGLGLACGYPEGFRKVMDYHRAYLNLMRGYKPGQFFAMPCRSDSCDLGFPRQFTSATVGLLLAVKERQLQIAGAPLKPCRLGGCVPQNYKGKMDTAYRAIVKRDFAAAIRLLQNPTAENEAAAREMLEALDKEARLEIAALEALEKAGDIGELKERFSKARSQFGLLESFKDKATRFEEGLQQEPWKLEVKLAANYRQLLDALKRNKTAAYAGDLQRFGEKYPDSLYGQWATEVAKEYSASGTIRNPSVAIPTTLEESSAAPPAASSVAGGGAAASPAANGGSPAVAARAKTVTRSGFSPEALEPWQARFVKKLDALGRTGRKLKIDLGDSQEYLVRGANEQALIVSTQGNDLPMPWRLLSIGCRAALAKDACTDDDVEALLIAAVLQLAAGRADQSETLFAKAALKDAEAVKTVKAALGNEK